MKGFWVQRYILQFYYKNFFNELAISIIENPSVMINALKNDVIRYSNTVVRVGAPRVFLTI